jgi:sugar phosphate isomerase/epimerase
MSRQIQLGVNTCFAVKRWPEPERWIAIIVEDLGLRYCQFSFDLVDPLMDEQATGRYADAVQRAAQAARLTVHSTFTGVAAYSTSQLLHPHAEMRAAAAQWWRRAIDFTARMGATATGGHVGAFSMADAADPERRRTLLADFTDRLQALQVYAAGRGLSSLLVENMPVWREYGYSIAEARALTAIEAPGGVPLVLCLDVGHPGALRVGTPDDDYRAWLHAGWARSPVLHVQQSDREGDRHWPFTARYNEAGLIDASLIRDAVLEWPGDDDIYVFLEVIHGFEADESSVLDDLRASVRHWRAALESMGAGHAPGDPSNE